MSFLTVKDVMLIGFTVSSAALYDVFRPSLGYLFSTALFLVVWEAAGWNGGLSIVALALGFAAMALAVLHRLSTQRPLRTTDPANVKSDFWVSFGLFAFWFFFAIVISVTTS